MVTVWGHGYWMFVVVVAGTWMLVVGRERGGGRGGLGDVITGRRWLRGNALLGCW